MLHGADSPMMRWAARAQVGGALRLSGPRANLAIPRVKGRPVAMFLGPVSRRRRLADWNDLAIAL